MQVFRLVEGGKVDRMISFDSLPESLIAGVRQRNLAGLPRHWKAYAEFHYFLDYKDVNADREKWESISNFVRKAVDLKTRLRDKLEDMALPMAPDPHAPLELEPEDIPVINIPLSAVESAPEIITETESIPAPKRGRQKKVSTGA